MNVGVSFWTAKKSCDLSVHLMKFAWYCDVLPSEFCWYNPTTRGLYARGCVALASVNPRPQSNNSRPLPVIAKEYPPTALQNHILVLECTLACHPLRVIHPSHILLLPKKFFSSRSTFPPSPFQRENVGLASACRGRYLCGGGAATGPVGDDQGCLTSEFVKVG